VTLLFAYVDDNYVMQLADERISLWNASLGKWSIRDDHTAKLVLVRGSLILSFTDLRKSMAGIRRLSG
jgi:hypothetical protein